MTTSLSDLLREARAAVPEVGPPEAELLTERGARLIDVRERSEWDEGHIAGAAHVSRSYLEQQIEGVAPDRDATLVLYCAGGTRSLFAAQTLQAMGYTDVRSMSGGFQGWKSSGRPWTAPVVLSREQKQRYSRHLLVPEVGAEGQAKLLGSKVRSSERGAWARPACYTSPRRGGDHRHRRLRRRRRVQPPAPGDPHHRSRGRKKTESAAEAVRALNPDVTVVPHEEMLTDANVDRLIAGYDLVLDGTDTFETRYTLNDAAVRARIPVVHASVFRFEGQLTVFQPYEGPCYRCLYPTPPPPELAPGCSVAGVLGVVPGIMGLLQASEALKLLLGIGEPLIGRLLLHDALDGTFSELQLRRDPRCPACGDGTPAATASGVFTLGAEA